MLNIDSGNLKEHRCLRVGKDKNAWINSFANELGRLTQGIQDFQGTNFMTFIHHSQMHKDKKIACSQIACAIRPQKLEKHRTRMDICGDILDYEGKSKAPPADLITMKILLNIMPSTPGAKFMTIGIKMHA